MNKKCPNCAVVNFPSAAVCVRCQNDLRRIVVSSQDAAQPPKSLAAKLLRRGAALVVVIIASLFAFYLSLLYTSAPLAYDDKLKVKKAVEVLDEKGFAGEVFLLRYAASFRASDNWLNSSTRAENAYAATNYPFEIMTLYTDFFSYPQDDTERAAVLLHEAQHLKGADEREAYEFVWKNRKKLGWTKDKYFASVMWQNVRKQTKEYAPNLFVCEFNELGDCTE